ncbi:hypothetical protein V6L77_05150 [Pannonibacter sp. Pt2-lr]|uniref:Uncharacterized protein n=1 Tax=Pannonibacter anstelovis TaxID=3121537 RepID=A0ABU7ZTU1_9HYPH
MSVRYPLDPFDLPYPPDLPRPDDFAAPSPRLALPWRRRLALGGVALAMFSAATAGAAVLIFLPVLLADLWSLEAVRIGNAVQSATQYRTHLIELFLGTLVLAGALVSFVFSLAFGGRRPYWQRLEPRRLRGSARSAGESRNSLELRNVFQI